MNRRILISEDERSRILGLHEDRKRKEWSMLFEQMAGAGEPDDLNLTTTPTPTTGGGGTQLQPSGQATLNYQTAKFPDVNACIAEGRSKPKETVAKFGLNWVDTPKKWIASKCNGTTPCTLGNAITNQNLAKALCEGTFGAASSANPVAQTTGSATGTTFYIDNIPTQLNTDQEISDNIKAKKITQGTFVFKSPEIPKAIKISALPEDSPIKKAIMAIIATVPPDLPGETFKIIGADGKPVDMDIAAIEKGLMDKTMTAETPALDPKTNTWSKVGQIETLKTILAKVVPDYKAPQAEMPSTGNKTLDEWLKTQAGQTYLSKTDRPSQEAFIDYLEQSGDPIIASVGGKEALRKILLGDVNKDTKFGRWLQRGTNKLTNVGKVLKGQDVVANTGFNPTKPA